jgi:SAM-dependent methyltransferase
MPTCLVCGHAGLERHLDRLLRCPACTFVTSPESDAADAHRLYDDSYFSGGEYLDYRADETFFRESFRKRLPHVLRRRSSGRLLEVGAAYGFFLDLAREHFEVVGYEVNREAARHARENMGLDVRTDDFLASTVDGVNGPVDVTVMWDVIEHLARPDLYLAHVAALSRPGALLYLTTGDIGSLVARWRGSRWRMIHPPTHLHYFSRPTLTRLLARHGFRVVEIRAVGVARSIRQMLYVILVLRMARPRAYAALTRIVPASWGFTLNTLDIMQVVAERTGCTS